jgi:nitroimidazol reductase NimA-like FMN-containing flavoprotein (pyridoxamine 5'-phosphate oxidase superfamily)
MLSERTRVRRRSIRGAYDADLIFGILDLAPVCHVGFVVDGQPYVIPTIHTRIGHDLYFHGAVANRLLGTLAGGAPVCVTATLIDGLVLARSAMHHSMNYRSVVVLGTAALVTDPVEARAAFTALVDRVRPGRSAQCRPPSDAELQVTKVVKLRIEEASAKVRSGPPVDDPDDLASPHWAGVIPLHVVAGAPEPAPDLNAGIVFPHDGAQRPPRDAPINRDADCASR